MFVPDKPLHPNQHLRVGQSGATVTCKHYTRLERLPSDKHSSLLRTFVNYERERFYSIWAQRPML
jgi:hypothetical protein